MSDTDPEDTRGTDKHNNLQADHRRFAQANAQHSTSKYIVTDKDTGLQQIKCDTRKLFKHEGDKLGILPKGSVRIIINGKSGTGKSHLLRLIIPMLHKPTHVIICSTVIGNDVHEGIRKYCKGEKIKYSFHLEPDEFLEQMADIVEKKKTDDHVICIFDDFTDCHTGKNNVYHNCAIRAFSKWRNYNCSCIMITPDVSDIKTNIRNSSNIQILFPVENPYGHIEFKKILRNRFPHMSATHWENMYNHISTHDYNFIMFADTSDHKKFPHLRLNWTEIIYPCDDADANTPINENDTLDVKYGGSSDKAMDRRKLNHNHGYGLYERQQLLQQAHKKGLPHHFNQSITKIQLQRFLKATQHQNFSGSMDMLMKIIGETQPSKQAVLNRLYRNIRKYHNTDDEARRATIWSAINFTCNQLIKFNYIDKYNLKTILERHGVA